MEKSLVDVMTEKYSVSVKWMNILHNGYSIPKYLAEKGINSIVVYGLNDFAHAILDEYKLSNKLNDVKAIIDKKIIDGSSLEYHGIPCMSLNDAVDIYDEKDVYIITPMGWKNEIRKELESKGIVNFIYIDDLVYDAYDYQKGVSL